MPYGNEKIILNLIVELLLYGSTNCHLCDRLTQLIRPHLEKIRRQPGKKPAVLIKRNIFDNPAWAERYRTRIPVLIVDERVILEGRPEPEQVDEAMRNL